MVRSCESRTRAPGLRRLVGLAAVLCLAGATSWGASTARAVTCSAQVDRARVAPGEQVVLTLTLEGDFRKLPNIQPPAIDGVDVMSGGTSQSVNVVPGRVNTSLRLTWYLTVRRADSFRIPPFAVEVEGQIYNTQPIQIEVVPAAAGPPARQGPARQPAAPVASTPRGGVSAGRPGDPFFVTLTADRPRAWVGEQVVLVFRFHRGTALWDSPQYRAPRSEGFWREDLPPERSYIQTLAGVRYEVTEIRYALFPARPGRLVIEPAEVTIPPDPFARLDRFFGTARGSDRAQLLRTASITLDVRPLPKPEPAGYSGLVARNVALEATLDPRETARGEPTTMRVSLRADGFLKGFAGVPLPALTDVELHDAGESLAVDKSGDRLTSRLVVEKVLVPRHEGQLVLPPVTLVYFDPAAGRFATARADLGALQVRPGSGPAAAGETGLVASGPLERLGRDLAFVHPAPARLRRAARPFVAGPGWWLAAGAPVLLLGALRLRLARQRRAAADPSGWRRTRAWATAKRALKEASRATPATTALAAVGKAVRGYVADRTGQAAAAIDAGAVKDYALRLGRPATGEALARLLAVDDEARFAAGAAAGPGKTSAGDAVAQASRLLMDLERAAARRRDSGASAALMAALAMLLIGGAATCRPRIAEAAPAEGAGTPEQLVAEGNAAYTAGDYAAAMTHYRAARAAGIDDAVLHYNLGNACARRGELGRAELAYLRALRLAPRDRDTRANLAFVRAQARDRELQGADLPPIVAQLADLLGVLSLDEWSVVLLALMWAVAATVFVVWRRGSAGDLLRRTLVTLSVGLCLVAAIVGWRYWAERVQERVAIVVPEAEVRSGPAESFPVLFRVHDGLLLTVRGREDGWVQVGLGGDWVGWTPAAAIESLDGPGGSAR